jgi:hypothetical protein
VEVVNSRTVPVGDLNNVPSNIRACQYWNTAEKYINVCPHFSLQNIDGKMALNSILPEEILEQIAVQHDSALVTIFQYMHGSLQSLALSSTSNNFLSLILGIYDCFSNSTQGESPERCGICGDPVPAKSRTFGSCAKGHLFRTFNAKLTADFRTLFNYVTNVVYSLHIYVSDLRTQETRQIDFYRGY